MTEYQSKVLISVEKIVRKLHFVTIRLSETFHGCRWKVSHHLPIVAKNLKMFGASKLLASCYFSVEAPFTFAWEWLHADLSDEPSTREKLDEQS